MYDVNESPEHKIAGYMDALQKKLGQKGDVQASGIFDDVVQKVLNYESLDKSKTSYRPSGFCKPGFKNPFAPISEIPKIEVALRRYFLKGCKFALGFYLLM